MSGFRTLISISAALALTLSVLLLVVPGPIFALFSVTTDASGDFVARRAAALFLGVAVTSFLARDLAPSPGRSAIAAGVAVMMLALALLGTVEFVRGYAGPGIFLAVIAEAALGGSLLMVWMRDRHR